MFQVLLDVEATIQHRRKERALERTRATHDDHKSKTVRVDEKSNLSEVDHIMDGLEVRVAYGFHRNYWLLLDFLLLILTVHGWTELGQRRPLPFPPAPLRQGTSIARAPAPTRRSPLRTR